MGCTLRENHVIEDPCRFQISPRPSCLLDKITLSKSIVESSLKNLIYHPGRTRNRVVAAAVRALITMRISLRLLQQVKHSLMSELHVGSASSMDLPTSRNKARKLTISTELIVSETGGDSVKVETCEQPHISGGRKESVSLVLEKFRDLNLDDTMESVGGDDKDGLIVTLVQKVKDLEKKLKERKDWAQKKAMHAVVKGETRC
ncbi:hypothetical protein IGI04_019499 [Brassica rapa subsp. trilocularis]|uniref:NPH3 domain-containing protein n=1 Tax=Brassica rapa subsp. trilocularis TaxID=1813537 RepID=A0ABQ7MGV6_BRACM|nr:hypothetical protein IGI04_019499 [Brassica rapa subsp. trilocularis]